ncbi:MAG: type II toxin-antitoxin system RelE/ParE family toxin [Candidatus Kapabacteria bacterium]|jgi:addiction module RelE/StbE family toxin|nr:type II toxin-antitoxin system RelE/ParE family toxin [Candidatus Kapabacteria bacterium]
MVSLNWTEQAVNDLNNVYDYISKDSKHYAIQHISRIRSKCSILKTNPLIGRIVPEFGIQNLRELIFGNYRIIYKVIDTQQIDILTIFHAARLLKIDN